MKKYENMKVIKTYSRGVRKIYVENKKGSKRLIAIRAIGHNDEFYYKRGI